MRIPRPARSPLFAAAALYPHITDARPILLPFLYPGLEQRQQQEQQQQEKAASKSPRRRRTPKPTASTSSARARSGSYPAERLPQHLAVDGDGRFHPQCWNLLGQSNCPREPDDSDPGGALQITTDGIVYDDPLDLDLAGPSSSNSTATPTPSPVPTTSTRTTSAQPTPTSSAHPTSTTKPYTMTFQVTNIPSGWQRNERTHFYSTRTIIGFSVSLSVLIILTIVACVIWRIRAARVRRDSERALAKKKREIARGLRAAAAARGEHTDSDSDEYTTDDGAEERETTRQRGIRRRRRNVRAPDNMDDTGSTSAVSRRAAGPTRLWPSKWRVRRVRRVAPQEVDEEKDQQQPVQQSPVVAAPEALEQPTSETLDTQPPTTSPDTPVVPTAPAPVTTPSTPPPPASPPPPPPPPPPPTVQAAAPPPAYRRGTFGRSRPATAPAAPSRHGKERELDFDVPEEYLYLSGVPPQEQEQLSVAPPVVRSALLPAPVLPVPEEDAEELEEADEEVVRREDVTAHIATDDKAVLQRLEQIPSAPPEATTSALAATAPRWADVEDDEIEYDDEQAGPSHSNLLPAPPAITSAHLFVPPSSTDLPEYAGSSSAPPPEKRSELEIIPSAPPTASAPPLEPSAPTADDLAPSAPPLEPSAPPLDPHPTAPTYEP